MTPRWSRAAALAGALAVVGIGGVTVLLGGGGRAAASRVHGAAPAADWGMKVVGLRQTAGGFLLDLRLRVVDPVKAAPLFDRDVTPYLLHQRTGARFLVPRMAKLGPMRSRSNGQLGRTDFIVFANPGRLAAPGDRMTLVLGHYRSPDLVVE
jgi:hypothetical protein